MNEYIYNLWPYLKLCNFAQNHANFSVFCHSKWTSALKVVLHTADMNDDEQKKKQNHKKLRRHNSLIMDLQHQQTSNKSREAQSSLFI